MDINYERIFDIAINLADAPQEIKAFCIREQKKSDRDYFYKEDDFYKGLLKVVADKKQLAKYQSSPVPTQIIGSLFIAGGGGLGYNYESIEVVEQIINEICNESYQEWTKSNPFYLPQSILLELEKEGFISNAVETPIVWLKNKQLLRELLMHKNIKREGFKSIYIENATPYYFVDKEKYHIKLANNKPEPSIDSDWIKKKCDLIK